MLSEVEGRQETAAWSGRRRRRRGYREGGKWNKVEATPGRKVFRAAAPHKTPISFTTLFPTLLPLSTMDGGCHRSLNKAKLLAPTHSKCHVFPASKHKPTADTAQNSRTPLQIVWHNKIPDLLSTTNTPVLNCPVTQYH